MARDRQAGVPAATDLLDRTRRGARERGALGIDGYADRVVRRSNARGVDL
jgi:hypothetical protein